MDWNKNEDDTYCAIIDIPIKTLHSSIIDKDILVFLALDQRNKVRYVLIILDLWLAQFIKS